MDIEIPSTSRSVNDESIGALEKVVESLNQVLKDKKITRKRLFTERKPVTLDNYRRSIVERALKGRSQLMNTPQILIQTSTPMPNCMKKTNRSISVSPITKEQDPSVNNNDNNVSHLSINKSKRNNTLKVYNGKMGKLLDNEQNENNISLSDRSNFDQNSKKSVSRRLQKNNISQRNCSKSENVQILNENVEELNISLPVPSTSHNDNNVEKSIEEQQSEEIDESEIDEFLREIDNLIFHIDDSLSSLTNDTEISTKKPWRNSKSFVLPTRVSGSFDKNPSFVKKLNRKLVINCNRKKSFVNKKSMGVKSKIHQPELNQESVENFNDLNELNTNCNENNVDSSDDEVEFDTLLDFLTSIHKTNDVSVIVDENENCDDIGNVRKPTKQYNKKRKNNNLNTENNPEVIDNNVNLTNSLQTYKQINEASVSNHRNGSDDINRSVKTKNNSMNRAVNNKSKDIVDGIGEEIDNAQQRNNKKSTTNTKSKKSIKRKRKTSKKQKVSEYIREPTINENNPVETTQDGLRRSSRVRKPPPFHGIVIHTESERMAKAIGKLSNNIEFVNTTRLTMPKKRKTSVRINSEKTAPNRSERSKWSKASIDELNEQQPPLATIVETTNPDDGYFTNETASTSTQPQQSNSNLKLSSKLKTHLTEIFDNCGYIELLPGVEKLKLSADQNRLNLFVLCGKGRLTIGRTVRQFDKSERFAVEKGQNFCVTKMDINDHVLIVYQKC